jgi:quinol monooxygenase YgiN
MCGQKSWANIPVLKSTAVERGLYMIWVDVEYTIKHGKRDEFYSKLLAENIAAASRQEPGNHRYDYSIPMECADKLWLTELWTDAEALKLHGSTEHYGKLTLLKNEYVEHVKISKYTVSEL